jgi:hypothetical protein
MCFFASFAYFAVEMGSHTEPQSHRVRETFSAFVFFVLFVPSCESPVPLQISFYFLLKPRYGRVDGDGREVGERRAMSGFLDRIVRSLPGAGRTPGSRASLVPQTAR